MTIARDNRSGVLMEGEIKDNKFVVVSGPDFDPVFDIYDLSEVTMDRDEPERLYASGDIEAAATMLIHRFRSEASQISQMTEDDTRLPDVFRAVCAEVCLMPVLDEYKPDDAARFKAMNATRLKPNKKRKQSKKKKPAKKR